MKVSTFNLGAGLVAAVFLLNGAEGQPPPPMSPHVPPGYKPNYGKAQGGGGPLVFGPSSPSSATWTPIGPSSLSAFGGNVSGRITGIAVDPTSDNTIYIAAAGGGVHKTTDGGSTYTALTDNQATLAMGAIAVAPSNHLVIYAGTGEANNAIDNNYGAGILVSSDGGNTWSLSNAGGLLTRLTVSKISVHPTNASIAYAAVADLGTNGLCCTNTGIYKTTNQGVTWTNVTAADGKDAIAPWSDVVVDPNTPTTIYAAHGYYAGIVSNGIFRSTDGGTTWTKLTTGGAPNGLATGRYALAIAASASTAGSHVLYVAVANHTTYGLSGLYISSNADAASPTFTKLNATPDFLGGSNNPGQGWYDIAIGVDPKNAAVVYGAGQVFYNGCGGINCRHVVVSADSGGSWTDITMVGGVEPHTDSHAIAFDSTSRMLLGNDGGIWRYDRIANNWTNLNGNLNTIQFTQISLHPSSLTTVIGGSQDNGTEAYTGSTVWTEVDGGDGGFAAISQTTPTTWYHTYAGFSFERSDNSGGTWIDKSAGMSATKSDFYPPFKVDPGNGLHVLFGTDYVNESTNGGDTWTVIGAHGSNGFNPSDNSVDTIALGGGGTNSIYVYVATGGDGATSSQVFTTTCSTAPPCSAATTWNERDSGLSGHVQEIDVDPNDGTGQTAYAVINTFNGSSGQVFKTTNGGTSWSNISGSGVGALPQVPAWSLKVDTDASHTVYVSTETAGVFSSTSPFTTWTTFGGGLPNAEGKDLELNSTTRVLAVGTHGRGAWEIGLGTITAVKVTSFTAARNVDGQVLLEWETGFGADDLGYRLYRETNGQRLLITPNMIAGGALQAPPSVHLLAGKVYAWTDNSLSAGVQANYWLEVIHVSGGSDWYGPAALQNAGARIAMPVNSALLSELGHNLSVQSSPSQRRALSGGSGAIPRREMNAPNPTALVTQAALAGGPAVKISVKQEGWYRVTQQQLLAAGLNSSVDPRTLQMFVDGNEIPISVRGGVNGKLGPADSIEFYAIGLDTAASDSRLYWLVGDRASGQRIRPSFTPAGSNSNGLLWYSVEAQPRTIYFSSLLNGDKENFFGPVITTGGAAQVLTVHAAAANSSGSATLEVILQGGTSVPHTVQISLNGSNLGILKFPSLQEGVAQISVPQSLLVEGANTVTMAALADGDVSLVDTIRLSYWRQQIVDNNSLLFNVSGGQSYRLAGFSGPLIRLLDVTNPDQPQEFIGAISPTPGGFAIAFKVPGQQSRTLYAFVDGMFQPPAAVGANKPSAWRTPGPGADMIIVAHSSLMGQFAPLLQLRQAQGYKIAVVDVEDIFDEFSFGDKSPFAMRDFFSYTQANWKRIPRAVLLIGHASYDPKNYLGAGDSDLVPTRILDTATMETASDDWFTAFANDGLAQMQMGRLPARTAGEAALMISKIMEREASTQQLGVTLVADQTSADFSFGAVSEMLKASLPAGLPVDDIQEGQVGAASAQSALKAALAAGRQIVNYAGHGSVDLWRGDVLTDADAKALTNWANLPFFTIMTCLNGYFQDPILDSLSEALLKAPNGGASVVWAPSGMTDSAHQAVMDQNLFARIFKDLTARTLGDAIAKAKASVADTDIRLTWVLFGDPLMKKRPEERVLDAAGKPIVFSHAGGCSGNPASNLQQIPDALSQGTALQGDTIVVLPCRDGSKE